MAGVKRNLFPVLILVLSLAACIQPLPPVESILAMTPAAPPEASPESQAALPPAEAISVEAGPGADVPEAVDRACDQCVPAGAAGLGDPIYPSLGNSGYDVLHYTLDLAADPEQNTIGGTVTIEAVPTQDINAFNLDLLGLTVDLVTVDGTEANFSRQDEELIVTPAQTLAADVPFAVQVAYHGSPQLIDDPAAPIALGWQPQTGGSFVVSEPSGAMNWYPSNNHPSDKATYTFRITVPDQFEVAANGVLSETISGDGVSTYVWQMNQPMASYLATVHIGDYEVVTDTTESGVLIRNLFPSGAPNAVQASFDDTADMIEFVEDLIAPYPFDAYGVVLLAEPASWALETQTLSIFGSEGAWSPEVVMHELVHSWFGNDVSPATWQDTWLNEGFAQYFSSLWLDHIGLYPIDENMADTYASISYLNLEPPATVGVNDLFGASVYLRGAYTLHALRKAVGDDTFFEILREYYDRFQGSSASTADFVALVGELGGDQAVAVVDDWLYSETVPQELAKPTLD